jgi:hypothetical protein
MSQWNGRFDRVTLAIRILGSVFPSLPFHPTPTDQQSKDKVQLHFWHSPPRPQTTFLSFFETKEVNRWSTRWLPSDLVHLRDGNPWRLCSQLSRGEVGEGLQALETRIRNDLSGSIIREVGHPFDESGVLSRDLLERDRVDGAGHGRGRLARDHFEGDKVAKVAAD